MFNNKSEKMDFVESAHESAFLPVYVGVAIKW